MPALFEVIVTVAPLEPITPLAGPHVHAVTAGAVRSIVTAAPAAAEAGPAFPAASLTVFAVSDGVTVPSEHPATVTR
ncbi:MAG: hypothetical protein EBY80_15390 [Actinobacteria bacterium]|nr:hypothetical protein [Actinomycetota bacterium]NDA77716.1 hypothetical protein [Actinomycetota bacterium]